jgi:hypothetical protein
MTVEQMQEAAKLGAFSNKAPGLWSTASLAR